MAETLRLIWIGVVTMGILCMRRPRPPSVPFRAIRSSAAVHAVSRHAFLGSRPELPEARRNMVRVGSTRATSTRQRSRSVSCHTDLLNFLDASVSFYLGHGSIAGTSYGSGEAGAQATAQSERTKPVLVANRFHAISQASMMSARLRNTELASQWLRR
jgi:hypothetical protein